DVAEASRLVDVCLEAGLTMFDSADGYSAGMAEEILGQAIKGRREKVMISTKGTFRQGQGANDVGSSRHHITRAVEGSLKRVGTDAVGSGSGRGGGGVESAGMGAVDGEAAAGGAVAEGEPVAGEGGAGDWAAGAGGVFIYCCGCVGGGGEGGGEECATGGVE